MQNSIDFPLLLNKLHYVDYNWLLTGKGSPLYDPKSFDNGKIRGGVETVRNSKAIKAIDGRSVTLYDITAAINLRTLLFDRRQYALGKVLIPNIPVYDGTIFVNGDNMYPTPKSGDIVGFKGINSFNNVVYGEIYVAASHLDGDQYLTVKYANCSEKEGYVKLVNCNSCHKLMGLPVDAIRDIVIMKFSIRKSMMM